MNDRHNLMAPSGLGAAGGLPLPPVTPPSTPIDDIPDPAV